MKKIAIVIPTYNERENIEALVREILALEIKDLSILVVDDDSPDGTGKIVQSLAEEFPGRVFLFSDGRGKACPPKDLARNTAEQAEWSNQTRRRGRGAAMKRGFVRALEMGADLIVEMDADFSHHPRYLTDLISAMKDYDLVLGSRYVPGGGDSRGRFRSSITRFASFYVGLLTGIKVKDVDSGYRCFKRKVLENINWDAVRSVEHPLVLETLLQVWGLGFTIGEVPIFFEDRVRGKSKLRLGSFWEGLIAPLRWMFGRAKSLKRKR